MTEDEMVGWPPDAMGMSLSNFWKLVMDREAWCAASWSHKKSDMTEQLN